MNKSRYQSKHRCYPIFSDEDADLRDFLWATDRGGYVRRNCYVNGRKKPVCAHRIVLSRKLGRELLPTEYCDHANCNKLDNRRENLRLATMQQNLQNRLPRGPSGRRGVCFNKQVQKWQASVYHNGKCHYCGVFSDVEEAAEAARRKRVELGFFGEVVA